MFDYEIERLHLEQQQIFDLFGDYHPHSQSDREARIRNFIANAFTDLFNRNPTAQYRLGFDVAASGRGNLTVIYVDRLEGQIFTLTALFTCRTEDWHFIKTVLFTFMSGLRSVHACGDQTGLGRQICWEASQQFSGRFRSANFSTEKSDIAFTLMHQLTSGEKRFPTSEQHRDIASDYLALRKHNTGTRWIFTESQNSLNPSSHCDIAWAGGLASHANSNFRDVGAAVVYDHWDNGCRWLPGIRL
jgi:phage FluMu gp28-like protein